MADRRGFAPPRPAELLGWTGPDAGPPAPAVTADPTRDHPGVLSAAAARGLAVRLLGPAAGTAAWALTSPTTATAVVDGQRLLVVVDESDPYGWVTALALYQVTSGDGGGDEQAVPASPAVTAWAGQQAPGTCRDADPARVPGRAGVANPKGVQPMSLLLLVGLAILVRIFWGLVHSPFTPWLLLEWPVAIYLAALSVLCVWDLFVASKRRRTAGGRWR